MPNIFSNSITDASHKAAFLWLPGLLQEKVDDIFVSTKDVEVRTACFTVCGISGDTKCYYSSHIVLYCGWANSLTNQTIYTWGNAFTSHFIYHKFLDFFGFGAR